MERAPENLAHRHEMLGAFWRHAAFLDDEIDAAVALVGHAASAAGQEVSAQ